MVCNIYIIHVILFWILISHVKPIIPFCHPVIIELQLMEPVQQSILTLLLFATTTGCSDKNFAKTRALKKSKKNNILIKADCGGRSY